MGAAWDPKCSHNFRAVLAIADVPLIVHGMDITTLFLLSLSFFLFFFFFLSTDFLRVNVRQLSWILRYGYAGNIILMTRFRGRIVHLFPMAMLRIIVRDSIRRYKKMNSLWIFMQIHKIHEQLFIELAG